MCSDTALAAMSSVDANGGSVDVPEGPINPPQKQGSKKTPGRAAVEVAG